MNKLIVAICFGASALAVQLPAAAATTVVKKAVRAVTVPVATQSISPTASSVPVGVTNANNAGVSSSAPAPKLGGCGASIGNVPKKCKPPSGS